MSWWAWLLVFWAFGSACFLLGWSLRVRVAELNRPSDPTT